MKSYQAIAVALAMCAFVGCSQKTEADKQLDKTIENAKDAIDRNAENAKAELDAQRNEYDAKMQVHMNNMKKYLDSLDAAYVKAKGAAKERYRKQLAEYGVMRDTIVIGYERVRVAAPSDYGRLRAWHDSVMRENEFWRPNFNVTRRKVGASDGVALEPNKN